MGILQDGRGGEEEEDVEEEEEEVEEEEEEEGQGDFARMMEDNQRATPTQNVYNKHGFVVIFLPLSLRCIFSLLFHCRCCRT